LKFENLFQKDVLPSSRKIYPSTVITEEKQQMLSFPEDTTANFQPHSTHLMLIALRSGVPFNISLGFIDLGNDKSRQFQETQKSRLFYFNVSDSNADAVYYKNSM